MLPNLAYEPVTEEAVFAEMKRLLSLVWVTPDGEHRFHDGTPVAVCNCSALLMKLKFGGEIWGYFIDDNPMAALGRSEGGHDFLVVGDQIVDMWAAIIYGKALITKIDSDEARALYGDRAKWELCREEGN